jgi:ribosomal-protein-serine acetyltransferase
MIGFELPGGCRLRPLEESDADELVRLVDANREHLRPWMTWVDATSNTREERLAYIRRTRRQLAEDDGFQTAILDGDEIIGIVGFHGIDWRSRSTSIGYWLAADRQGKGTMTEAVRALTTHAFRGWGLHRVEIRVATGNERSAAIPLRLGFVEEGVLREAERHGDHFKDLRVYSMLAADWETQEARPG